MEKWPRFLPGHIVYREQTSIKASYQMLLTSLTELDRWITPKPKLNIDGFVKSRIPPLIWIPAFAGRTIK